MSASISSTREPPSASAIARLQAVVVLPSSGWLLVTAIMRVDCAPLVNTSDVRSERNASPKSCGTGSVSTGTRSPRTAGTRPSSGSFRRRVMSSGVLTVSSRYSMPNARPSAIVTPARSAVIQSLRGIGQDRRARHFGPVHHLHVVRAAVGDDRQLLLLLQQRLVDGRARCRPCASGCCSRRPSCRGRSPAAFCVGELRGEAALLA